MPSHRVGIDIGGTFTDFVIVDLEQRTIRTEKTATTPGDLWLGIEEGLRRAAVPIDEIEIAHGTTIALNTFLERRGSTTGLLTTRGFRDAYEIGRGARPDMYNLFYRKPVPLVPRRHRLEARERIDAEGKVLLALNDDDVAAAAEHFRGHGIEDIAVCFLHSYRNPEHELRASAVLSREYPEARISTSHQLVREPREYERTSTTVVNAYIRPRTGRYVEDALASLASRGYRRPFFVNQSSGGVISAQTATAKPVLTLFSGPAGGVSASVSVGKLAGLENVIAFDMGGTSTDVAVVWDGLPRLTADSSIEGHPIAVPAINIHSVGAGGGSIAWLDEVAALHVGPESAGAEPGPACYDRGGTRPTVTDANLVLGRVAPARFIPDGLELSLDAAAAAIERDLGAPLGLETTRAAAGVAEIVNLKMAMAVRVLTVQRGLDPKDFALLAFGGAGAGHACWVARQLGVPKVVVPLAPGQFSALGIALTDVRHDAVRSLVARPEELTPDALRAGFEAAEADAIEGLQADGVGRDDIVLRRSVDARYSGQEYTINVPVGDGAIAAAAVDEIRSRFHALHEQTYGHSSPEEPVEVTAVRIGALGRLPPVEIPRLEAGGQEPPAVARVDSIQTCFDWRDGYQSCDVWNRDELLAGNKIEGPAMIAELGATTIVPPAVVCTVQEHGLLVIDLPPA